MSPKHTNSPVFTFVTLDPAVYLCSYLFAYNYVNQAYLQVKKQIAIKGIHNAFVGFCILWPKYLLYIYVLMPQAQDWVTISLLLYYFSSTNDLNSRANQVLPLKLTRHLWKCYFNLAIWQKLNLTIKDPASFLILIDFQSLLRFEPGTFRS